MLNIYYTSSDTIAILNTVHMYSAIQLVLTFILVQLRTLKRNSYLCRNIIVTMTNILSCTMYN